MSEMKPVIIYGAGGHGKVVLDALLRSGREIAGFVDDDPQRAGDHHCGYPVAAAPGDLDSPDAADLVVAIGDAAGRQRATARVEELGYGLATAVHPTAVIADGVRLAPGAMVMAGAVVNPDVSIGRSTIINTGAIVDHDCTIGDFAHVGPGARLAGGVRVGARTLVGVGASAIPGVSIGADAVVAAGAVVVADVEDGMKVAGIPARPIG
ncbi:MAG: acetyltransferase [Gemmatimonadales bacterium]|jgi:UDP-perosamine 4-acetyltransferase